ncbi:MAG: hypothetical protein K2N78_12595 [Oscillospiraceae bacterium]|nr:hypothetical protein [Oscillospiraceae bacterium]
MTETNIKTPSTYFGAERVAELWAAIQAALGKKVDKTEMSKYTTAEAVAEAITTALADYATDAGMRAAISTALADYMTSSAVNDAIAQALAGVAQLSFEAVDELPETGEAGVIYLTPSEEDSNVRNQSMWLNGDWVPLGNTNVDLSNYWSKDELRPMTADELAAILV